MGQKLTIEEMQDIAKERGGECLSKNYVNAHSKLRWRCKEGHEWEATPDAIKYKFSWCPCCTGYESVKNNEKPIKEIYQEYIKYGPEKVIEEWAKYKSKLWYGKGKITIASKEFLDNRFSVNPKKYSWTPALYADYRLFNLIISNYKRRYIGGVKKKSRNIKKYSQIRKIPLIECEKCKSKEGLERHHIIPYSLGGDESPDNIVVLCKKCHNKMTILFLKNERKKRRSRSIKHKS